MQNTTSAHALHVMCCVAPNSDAAGLRVALCRPALADLAADCATCYLQTRIKAGCCAETESIRALNESGLFCNMAIESVNIDISSLHWWRYVGGRVRSAWPMWSGTQAGFSFQPFCLRKKGSDGGLAKRLVVVRSLLAGCKNAS